MALTQVKTLGIAADAVTGAKVADDQIDSEHYVAASIDNEHLADNAVDSAELAAGSVDIAHLATGTDGQIITWNASGVAVAVGPGTDGQVLTSTGAGSPPAFEDATLSFRNKIINGAMQVNQRGTTASVSDGYGGPDRYRWVSSHSVVTMSRSSDVPTGEGFDRSLKLDVTTAGGISNANTWTQLDYRLEGQDCKSLCYDTSNAKTTTLTFWIKSPKTGIHWCRLYLDKDGKFNSKKYTVSSADTWQKVSVTFAGNTSDGFDYDNTDGLRVSWYFGQGSNYTSGTDADGVEWLDWSSDADRAAVGQVNCMDSTSNDIYLTGVQFEIGDTATDFEHRSFGDELARCQRYYWKSYNHSVAPGTTSDPGSLFGRNYNPDSTYSQNALNVQFPVLMRDTPTTVNCYAPHSGTAAKVSAGASNPPDCATEKSFTTVHMLGDRGFSGIQTASIGSSDFFGAHFTVDAEL